MSKYLSICVHIDFAEVKPEHGIMSFDVIGSKKEDDKMLPGDKVEVIFKKIREEINVSEYWINLVCEGEFLKSEDNICDTNLENGSTITVKYNDRYTFASDMKLMGELDWIDFSDSFKTEEREKKLCADIISNMDKDKENGYKKFQFLMQLGFEPNCIVAE